MSTLLAVLFPALALPLLLATARSGALPRLLEPSTWPAQLWWIAVAGTAATVAGVLDWRFHRTGGRRVARAEHRAELLALVGGGLLFLLLTTASVLETRGWLLAPIVATALVVAGLIAFDETRFHRACGAYETRLHRVLVGGNGIAFLAWLHWCFARGGEVG
jgi:hypothetical protein